MEYTISNRMSALRGSAIREIFKYAADPAVRPKKRKDMDELVTFMD